MSFASAVFLIFLPAVFALYYCFPSRQGQNMVLLAASYFFYGWWDYRFCGLMLFASLLDFLIGWKMAETRHPRHRRWLLGFTLATNLGLLGFFKYFNFFSDSLVVLLSGFGLDVSTSTLNIVLPVGISFYTFQTLSYTLDIYRGVFQPRRDLIEYLAFVSFFPQLVAGPIERAAHLLPQFSVVRTFSETEAIEGCRLMLWGYLKKMVIADNLGLLVDRVFARPESASGAELVLAALFFTLQIYCDFSAYSEIATGCARLFGIRLVRNFAYPYFSQSISEFWRRWHISLSTWFRDYVYIPLGGNRGSKRKTTANILITMFLSGLWHGAAWHFVLWGLVNGIFLAAHRRFSLFQVRTGSAVEPPAEYPTTLTILRITRTFLLICGIWVLFRAENLSDAAAIYFKIGASIVTPDFYPSLLSLAWENVEQIGGIVLLISIEWLGRRHWNPLVFQSLPVPVRWLAYTCVVWMILILGTRRSAEFIYFQF